MSSLKKLEDLFEHQLKDIYSAESQLIAAFPKMIDHAYSDKLKKAFTDHFEETETHLERLENISSELNTNIVGETCKGMKGLLSEAKAFMNEDTETNVRDAGLIASAQRIEHYEIAAYGTVVEYAKILGHHELARLLEQSLKEETDANKKLNNLAIDLINLKAKV